MTTADLLERLRQLDVRLWAEGERLRFSAPEGTLTAELRSELTARKGEIIGVLSTQPSVEDRSPASLGSAEHSEDANFAPSFNQLPLWFHQQMFPDSFAYNIQRSVRLRGPLRIVTLERCLNEIVRRHDSLRTAFRAVDGSPSVVVLPELAVKLAVVDFRETWGQGDKGSDLELTFAQEGSKPFDLERGPPFRFKLVIIDRDDHVLITTVHHIVADGWSMGVFYHELSLLYKAATSGTPSPLPELSFQYLDFASWQRRWIQSEEFEQQLHFWERELRGAAPYFLDLPTDYQRPPIQMVHGKGHSIVLSKALTEGLKSLSRQEGSTLFVTLLAAFKALLFRYTRQEDILVGSPFACRTSKEIEPLIGYFVNVVVFRTDLTGNPSFRELLGRIKQKLPGMHACQQVPFEKLVERLQPGRSLIHTPIVQVLFNLLNFAEERLQISGVDVEYLAPQHHAKFDLTVTALEKNQRLGLSAGYNADLFATSTIERMLQHFRILLEGIVQNPDGKITRLPLLPDQECLQLMLNGKGPASQQVSNRCIHQLFEAQAQRTPNATALIHEDIQLSYGELNQRSNQLAHFLKKLGVGPEWVVGICIERSPEMVVALLGVLKAGGAYLPLDPSYPADRLSFMIEDADARLLLTQKKVAASLPQLALKAIALDSEWEAMEHESRENPACDTFPEDLAYLIYTSGSTGRSKGVEISHRSLANFVAFACEAYEITHTDRVLQFASIGFDAAVEEIYPCLTQGGTLVLRTDEMLDSVPDFLTKCKDWRLTILDLPTAYWHELTLQVSQDRPPLPADLRLVIIGGETADPERLVLWKGWAKDKIRLINTYGPTESTVVSTLCDLSLPVEGEKQRRHVPIGSPITNVQAYLLDAHLQPAPIGVPGEIYLGGDGLARGYHNYPELTAEKFVPDPFSGEPGARLYRTGDIARYGHDGNLEFLGRADRQVKIRGYRIELGEIEATLTQHSTVRQAAVVLREDLPGDKRLVAYVVPRVGGSIRTGGLQQFLRGKLPAYMVPSVVVQLKALPITPSGKLERSTLPAPVPSVVCRSHDTERRTPIEEVISDIWSQVLNVRTVRRYDNFFDLGGHSLLALRVVSRVRQAFGIDLPVRQLFESQTLGSLSEQVEAVIRKSENLDIPPLTSGNRGTSIPLSFVQQRFWLLDQLEPGNPFYNIHIGIRMHGSLNQKALERALEAIVVRHEILRTCFVDSQGDPSQVVNPSGGVPLPVIDLGGLPNPAQEAEATRLAELEARRPFDLSRGPLLRVTLLRLADQENILLLVMHHIVSDGWSMGVLYRELAVLYEAFCDGESPSLPDLPIQYADYAIWQRQWLQGDVLEEQLSYWKTRLEGAPALFEIPTDYPRPAVQQFQGSSRPVVLSAELTEALKTLGRSRGATLFMTLLAAFKVLLYRYAGQEDLVVGSPIAGRNHVQTENLIGVFINMLVLRTSMSEDPSFYEFLGRVRQVTLDAYSHPDVPFERLVETLKLKRSLGYNPLFQVMFALQNAHESPIQLSGLALNSFRINKGASKFDLSLGMVERDGALRGELAYNTGLFSESTISRMADDLRSVFEAVVARPEERLSRLQVPSDTEWHRMRLERSRSFQALGESPAGSRQLSPAADSVEQKTCLEGPASPVEQLLAEIWSQILAIETVSPADNFFEMGGHSLLGTRLVSRVRKTFGIEFPLRCVFENPTLREMAAVIIQTKLDLIDSKDISRIVTELEKLSDRQSGTLLSEEISPEPA